MKKRYNMISENTLGGKAMNQSETRIIIAPANMHDQLRIEQAQNHRQLQAISILTLSAFLHRDIQEKADPIDVLLKYREALKDYHSALYENILLSLTFLKQCYALIEDLKLYHIPITALPSDDAAKQELKAIISVLYPILTPQDQENAAWERLKNTDLSAVQIIDTIYSAQDNERIKRLCGMGAKRYTQNRKQPEIHYVHMLNKRKETEYIAQWLIQEKLSAQDIQITICDDSYALLIHQVFRRYHIPFTIMKQTMPSVAAQKAQALLRYVLTPNQAAVISVLETHAVSTPYQKEFIDYVTLFNKELQDDFHHIQNKGRVSQLISQAELERLLRLEQKANQCKEVLQPILKTLTDAQTPQQLFIGIDNIIGNQTAKNDVDQLLMLKKLQELFTAFLPYFHEKNDIHFLLQLLDDQQEQKQEKQYHGALITTLHQPLLPSKIGIVIGATQKQYPAFPKQSGFFNEAYLAQISEYPSLMMRHQQYLKQLEAYLFSYSVLFVSYPLGGYDGKSNESALEAEQLLQQKAVLKEPYRQYIRKENHYHIDKESAKRLFLKQDKLYGSISSLEKYVRCPFSYFLSYGLKIKEPLDYEFSQSRIGTLLHYILETLVNTYHKDYPNADAEVIERLIQNELTSIADIYPLLSDRLTSIKQRIYEAIRSNLMNLKENEEHSSLYPFACEHEFWWDITLREHLLCLHGFIDRIDANDDFMRIIDYKSSKKTMSEKDFCAGMQLQLCAYAVYAYEKWQKRMLGAFYYSLKQENINADAGKMKRRPMGFIPYDNSDWEEQRKNAQRLRGWVMDPHVEAMDNDGTHIYGVKQNKNQEIKATRLYPIEELKDMLMTVLEHITKRILSGDIACEPTEDACTFCPYHDICRFHGYVREADAIVSFANKEKEKVYADME